MKPGFSVPTSNETSRFYDDLMDGKEQRGTLGKDARYNSRWLLEKESLALYFDRVISEHLDGSERLLDFGCGPGTFSARVSNFCREVVGVDISQRFVDSANQLKAELGAANLSFYHSAEGKALPFAEGSFDALLLMDVIHHLENIDETLAFAFKYLKKGGKVLVYEPNKLNPLIALVHVFDKNEWGLLKLGTPAHYRRILGRHDVDIESMDFNGIVIGPSQKTFDRISAFLNKPAVYPAMGWLNPKIFVSGRKK